MKHHKVNSRAVIAFSALEEYDAKSVSISSNTIKLECKNLQKNKTGKKVSLEIMLLGWSYTEEFKGVIKNSKNNTLTVKITPTKMWKDYLKIVPKLLEDRLI